jgi:hypothetical protein
MKRQPSLPAAKSVGSIKDDLARLGTLETTGRKGLFAAVS